MKQSLHFLNEQEFQTFCSQLFFAEMPSFHAIEGSGGDGGLDGLDGTTAFQDFFPDVKNRNDSNYKAKIDDSLEKLSKTITKEQFSVTRWIFVTPEDLRAPLIIYLQKKSKELGFECLSWGATKLTELVNKHPHIRNSFPAIFLPDVKEDIGDVKDGIIALNRPRSSLNIEIITDKEFREKDAEIDNAYRQQVQGAIQRFGTSSSAHIAASEAHREEANRKKRELR